MNAVVAPKEPWKIVEVRSPGKYQKYITLMCIIVHRSTKKAKHHSISMYFPPKVFAALGEPKRIEFYMRGSNVGIKGVEQGGYAVQSANGWTTHRRSMPFCNATGALEEIGVATGVYSCHSEDNGNGMVVFDSAEPPSQP